MALNKTLGSSILVAGTTIGAGMLAMPLVSSHMGFFPSLIPIVISWILSTYLALLFIELYQFTGTHIGFAGIAKQYFGHVGSIIVRIALLVFLFALLCAYTLGLSSSVMSLLSIDQSHATLVRIIILVIIGILLVLGMSFVDLVNRLLFIAMIICLAIIFGVSIDRVESSTVHALQNYSGQAIALAIPTFFLSFGFQAIVPSIVEYQQGDLKGVKRAILIGTTIPLIIYILWLLIFFGIVKDTSSVKTLDDFTRTIATETKLSKANILFSLFQLFAVVTSIIGVSLAGLSAVKDLFAGSSKIELNCYSRAIIVFIIFLIPLLAITFYMKAFVETIAFAGILFIIYSGILPTIATIKSRFANKSLYKPNTYKVPGGLVSLFIVLLICIALIVNYVMNK